jgi:hypothetical protein
MLAIVVSPRPLNQSIDVPRPMQYISLLVSSVQPASLRVMFNTLHSNLEQLLLSSFKYTQKRAFLSTPSLHEESR